MGHLVRKMDINGGKQLAMKAGRLSSGGIWHICERAPLAVYRCHIEHTTQAHTPPQSIRYMSHGHMTENSQQKDTHICTYIATYKPPQCHSLLADPLRPPFIYMLTFLRNIKWLKRHHQLHHTICQEIFGPTKSNISKLFGPLWKYSAPLDILH